MILSFFIAVNNKQLNYVQFTYCGENLDLIHFISIEPQECCSLKQQALSFVRFRFGLGYFIFSIKPMMIWKSFNNGPSVLGLNEKID